MFQQIDNRFLEIDKIIKEKGGNFEIVQRAYELAKELHKNQIRKDGTPYLSHPVEVALILAKLDFDENVICSALLHDVVEDCEYSLEQIKEEFNTQVMQMVDCVSAVDKAKYVFDNNDIFEDENFEKASIEEQSFKKLVLIGKQNSAGICIKFADRLHNLRTIGTFPYSKQLEKVKETEKWIIPLAKILNAEYFYRAIKNECFRVVHNVDGKMFFAQIENYLLCNKTNIESLIELLNESFSATCVKMVKIKRVREYKVFEDLTKKLKNLNISKVSQGQILKVANYNIYLLYSNKSYEGAVQEVFDVLNKLSNNFWAFSYPASTALVNQRIPSYLSIVVISFFTTI